MDNDPCYMQLRTKICISPQKLFFNKALPWKRLRESIIVTAIAEEALYL